MRIRKLNHSTYQLEYHIVWSTKYRRKILKPYVRKKLLEYFDQTEFMYPTLHILKTNMKDDHVHMLVEIAPSVSIAAMVQKLKNHSSKELKRRFKFMKEMDDGSGIWSVGYFVSSIGLDEAMIGRYIDRQNLDDRPRTTRFEFS